MNRNSVPVLILVVALTIVASLFVWPNGFSNSFMPWRLGLDLIGGSHLLYEVDMSAVDASDRTSVLNGLRDVMERRVNVFGVSEPQVYTSKVGESHRIIVDLAGIKDSKSAIQQIGRTAKLDFREVLDPGSEDKEPTFAQTGLDGRFFKKSQVAFSQNIGEPEILIEFDSEGARLFEEITGRNVGRPLAIFLDDELISAPTVNEKIIGGSAVISGRFTADEAKNLAGLLNAGALPAPVNLISQQVIGASLGADSLNKTLVAGLAGTLLVMLFMLVYYHKLGFFSVVALFIYVVLTSAVFKLFGITMTLSGIAGFILSIGMAVDANILIFERTKEGLKKNISMVAAIEDGFSRAWLSIRDSNVTTMITSVILYYATTGFVKGFALALLIGVIISMFSAISVTRTLLRVFMKNQPVNAK
ncbi:MAG: protein translocase subunit SecD [bacterium]|nr:protein translocase subunit SecD [bacterium]